MNGLHGKELSQAYLTKVEWLSLRGACVQLVREPDAELID
jgi:hypothetical protein